MNTVRVPRRRGRPRSRPEHVVADRGYDAARIRKWLRERGIKATIPERSGKKPRRGRPYVFRADTYKRRNVIERCIGWLKECRRLATRYEKKALHYLAMIKMAFIERYLKKQLSNRA
jgi:transposase